MKPLHPTKETMMSQKPKRKSMLKLMKRRFRIFYKVNPYLILNLDKINLQVS